MRSARVLIGGTSYVLLLVAFWQAIRFYHVGRAVGGHVVVPFIGLAAMFGLFWAFGWGVQGWLRARLGAATPRLLAPGFFAAGVYALLAAPIGDFRAGAAVAFFALPSGLALLMHRLAQTEKLTWADLVALAALGLPIEYGWFRPALPQPGLSDLPKFLFADIALYLFLVVRPLKGVGFDLAARWSDVTNGVRHWLYFTPIGIGLGLALHFIHPHGGWPGVGRLAGAALVTFIFVALPEELFFRGILQNLLETRLGSDRALLLAAGIFGLSHYVHGPTFNWRYVILAAIAGGFYGRAWRRDHRLFASALTHTLVDVLWGAWFRL
ncbi:MAG: CPBP family intramembrane glutamic endopeptidase [Terriglobales bacterium]